MVEVNAMGDTCPIPVIKTKKAIEGLNGAGVVETLVDNEIAVQNLKKMADQKGYKASCEKLGDNQYKVKMTIGEAVEEKKEEFAKKSERSDSSENTVVVISSSKMGEGEEELGKVLIKGFIYALTQLDTLPKTMLFYNGGAFLTCEGSESLEDLKFLKEQGVEIFTCGTCLNYYGLTEKLQVGEITNMYVIAEKMTQADKVVKP
ncbi:sulfurtransferase-like selenium metabolism protein YedF [Anaerostipes sp. MSJ-23]|uniref:sulfurtransferase-like selenium metabolism protein YedF n=1 Tax=unclassified Anaerostipes TaxID=2635253 RepID=UPI001C122948|nr:sulfurtransferase-like selenium metabolism protein YedF [Anaerostipes sp. MSJ-23]MBU5460681.1 sulfurtransferase-like selenium metabolism protein YedF [Anaerostipes sp. MSJ-23]